MKRLVISISVIIFIVAGFGIYFLFQKQAPKEKIPASAKKVRLPGGITVEFIDSSYKVAKGQTSGFFKTGQAADIMLSGVDFNNTGGPLLFNHPGGIASDGKHLLLADRNNNRVLIWNRLPTSNKPPDIVLGQKNFITNNPGIDLNQLNWPVGVATDGKRLLVADTYNDRILIWNNFPTKSGQPADLVLGGMKESPVERRGAIIWPWAVWTNGEKVIVTSTGARQVLIWNKFPIQNNKPPDIVLALKGKFGTPRSIGSDGKHLVVGDHNAFGRDQGNFFWKSSPTSDDQTYDFFMAAPTSFGEKPPMTPFPGESGPQITPGEVLWGPTFTSDGKLLVIGFQLYIWNSFPKDENDSPDLILGKKGPEGRGYRFDGGDGSGLAIADGKLYLSLSNGNKIIGFNSIPTQESQKPDFAIGSPDIDTNTLEINFIISNPVPASNGKNLFVSSDFDRKLYIWKNLPDESGAKPDIVYSLPEGPWGNVLFEQTLALAGQKTVYIWKKLPLSGKAPDLTFKDRIGEVSFKELRGVALDERYFYLADGMANKIYVWEGIPSKDANPKFSLTTEQPWRLSSDGQYLVVTSTLSRLGSPIKIYSLANLSSDSQPTTIGSPGKFNLPQGATVSNGHLFVGDTGFNRVLIWSKIEDALAGKEADIILGAKEIKTRPEEAKPEIGREKLFWPAIPAFDGNYLWLGEFKFSERILRFSPQP